MSNIESNILSNISYRRPLKIYENINKLLFFNSNIVGRMILDMHQNGYYGCVDVVIELPPHSGSYNQNQSTCIDNIIETLRMPTNWTMFGEYVDISLKSQKIASPLSDTLRVEDLKDGNIQVSNFKIPTIDEPDILFRIGYDIFNIYIINNIYEFLEYQPISINKCFQNRRYIKMLEGFIDSISTKTIYVDLYKVHNRPDDDIDKLKEFVSDISITYGLAIKYKN